MALESKVIGIVIKSINYSENDKILTLLTTEKGIISAKIKGCKSPKSKLRYASSPLSFGEYFLVKSGKYLLVKSCNQYENFINISLDVDKYYLASLILEIIYKTQKFENDTSKVFVEVLKLLKDINYENISTYFYGCKIFLKLLEVLGFGINNKICGICGKAKPDNFSLNYGFICSSHCEYSSVVNYSQLFDELENNGKISQDSKFKEFFIVLNEFFTYHTRIKLKSFDEIIRIIKI